MDLVGIVVILVIIFGASMLPRMGEAIGRRIARSKGLPLPDKPSKKQKEEHPPKDGEQAKATS
jgi:Sec-independent protein translocase protein TatA